MSEPVIRLAPAKLNLTLAVVGRRSDGFHDLHSVFVPLDLADRLSVAPGTREDTLHVVGPDCGPTESNLVLRGIAAARRAVWEGPGRPATPPLAARLDKRIPVAAGLGGGSSDGYAAFDAALAAWGAGALHDSTGSYRSSFLIAGVCCVIAAIGVTRIGKPVQPTVQPAVA